MSNYIYHKQLMIINELWYNKIDKSTFYMRRLFYIEELKKASASQQTPFLWFFY